MLNPLVDKALCRLMGWVLISMTSLGQRRYLRMLQVSNGLSVAEHYHHGEGLDTVASLQLDENSLSLLALLRDDGSIVSVPSPETSLSHGDRLVLYGPDDAHEVFEDFLDAQS